MIVLEHGDVLRAVFNVSTKASPLYTILVEEVDPNASYEIAFELDEVRWASPAQAGDTFGDALSDGQGAGTGRAAFHGIPLLEPPLPRSVPLGPLHPFRGPVENVLAHLDEGSWVVRETTTHRTVAQVGVELEARTGFGTGTTSEDCDVSEENPWLATLLPGPVREAGPEPVGSSQVGAPLGGLGPASSHPEYQEPCEPGVWPQVEIDYEGIEEERDFSPDGDHLMLARTLVPYDLTVREISPTCEETFFHVPGAISQGQSFGRERDLHAGGEWFAMTIYGEGWEEKHTDRPRVLMLSSPAIYAHSDTAEFTKVHRPGITHGYGECSSRGDLERGWLVVKWLFNRVTKDPWWWSVHDKFTAERWDRSLERHCTRQYEHRAWNHWINEPCPDLTTDDGTSCIRWNLGTHKPNAYAWSVQVTPDAAGDFASDVVHAWDGGAYYIDCRSEYSGNCFERNRFFALPAIRVSV